MKISSFFKVAFWLEPIASLSRIAFYTEDRGDTLIQKCGDHLQCLHSVIICKTTILTLIL
jgi:hypothetical protein